MSEIQVIISPPIVVGANISQNVISPTAEASAEMLVSALGTPPVGLPAGGTTGQIPSKASNDDYDIVWIDNTGGGGGIGDAPNNANYYLRHALAWSIAATVAQTGAYADLTGKPSLGTAAAHPDTDFAAASHSHSAADLTSGTLADGRVVASNVTQHQASLSINYTQLTGTPPALLISTPNVVASQVAQLALTAQEGDIAIRTDQSKTYCKNSGTSGTMTDWNELLAPTAAVSSVFGRTGVVVAQSGDYTFAQIGSTPTTAAGYGIPAATGSIDGYATSTQITKLNGIATGATANSSDATLLARANHTGTQLASTISDFNTAADARVAIAISAINLVSKSTAYTQVLADAGGGLLHPAADTTARIWTIPANSSVPYGIGTTLTYCNQNAAGVITIAITSDTMRLAGAGTTGNRTLAANGIATAVKIATTEWLISGTGLS